MGKRLRWKGSTVFRKTFLAFLLILIPIYGVGFHLYQWGAGSIRNELYQSANYQEEFVINKMEMLVDKLRILQYNCLNSDNAQNMSNRLPGMSNREKYNAYSLLREQMNAIRLSDSAVEDVQLFFPDISLGYSARDGKINLDEYQALRYRDFLTVLSFSEKRIRLISTYPSAYQFSEEAYHKGEYVPNVMISTISIDKFMGNLEIENYEENAGIVVISGDNIYYKGKSDLKKALTQEEINQLLSYSSGDRITLVKDKVKYLVFRSDSVSLGFSLYYFVPEYEVLGNLQQFRMYLYILIIVSAIMIFLYSISIYNLIHRPINQLVDCFDEVKSEKLARFSGHMHNDEFQYLYLKYNEMITRIELLIDQNYRQKILLQQIELKHLQSQINPHFLFNSLFMLKRMIQSEDADNARALSNHLAEYFQFVTRSKSDYISLEQEMKHTLNYISIQQMRFYGRVQFCISPVPAEYLEYLVPRLIVQPLIENAVQYGMENKTKEGIISLSFVTEGPKVSIFIDDNGDYADEDTIRKLQQRLIEEDKEKEITALANINQRIRIYFEEGSGLYLRKSYLGGLSAELKMIRPADQVQTFEDGRKICNGREG